MNDLKEQMSRDRELRAVVLALLDRCDRTGSLPGKMVYRCAREGEKDVLARLLSANVVRPVAGDALAVRLDLDKAERTLREDGGSSLRDLLYEAAGRAPRDLKGEKTGMAAQAEGIVITLADASEGTARAFLMDAAGRLSRRQGDLFRQVWENGVECVTQELGIVARCIAAAEGNEGPVRMANFSRRATGTTKGIRTGDARYILLADALLRFLPGLADRVEAESPRDPSERRRLALECLGIFRNETPVDVLCFGSFVLDKRGARLDAPKAHRALGEPVRLMLLNLREAHAAEVRASRIVSIENETTFNDYVDQLREEGGDDIVLCSQGQANWAIVRLLRMLHKAEPTVQVFHWGDLDRSGVLILRSLRRRSGVPVQPRHMDPETLQRFSAEGLPLPSSEREEIEILLKRPVDDIGNDLLTAIRDAGKWVEQETVADAILGPEPS